VILMKIEYIKFVVDETPYCVWKGNLTNSNIEFINQIDPEYFEYIANINYQILKFREIEKNDLYAANSLRIAYSHGLETLFALIGATLQAPNCVVGWLLKYKLSELTSFVNKLNNHKEVLSRFELKETSWEKVSELIHQNLVLETEEKTEKIKHLFAKLWRRFAIDFLDKNMRYEYNSLKHGLRIKAGGFSLAFGLQDHPNIPAPSEKMRSLGGSRYGASFFIEKNIGRNKQNIFIKDFSRNWEPDNYYHGLKLISISIYNIRSCLQILNGSDPSTLKYQWPSYETYFEEPWAKYSPVNQMSLDVNVSEEDIKLITKEDILSDYKKSQKNT
jgi:hypothetical protein